MIEILGRPNSVNVQKVMWCSAELDLQVLRRDIGGAFGGNDQPEYLANNPNGRVPTLIDGDFVLWESNAIVRYLCDQYGSGSWHPETAQQRGHANQWMDWYLTTLHPPMTTLFWQLIRTKAEVRDQSAIETAITNSTTFWAMLDRHLADRAYILGDQPSMADIPVGCAAYRWHCIDFERPELPALKTWWNRLTEREAYRQHVMLPLT